MAVTLHCSWT